MAKEYIEREALLEDIEKSVVISTRSEDEANAELRGVRKILDRIKSAPTADVVEVVRCRDCVYMVKHWGKVLCAKRVYSDDYSVKVLTPTNLDNFCNYGAKMDGKGDAE